MEITYEILVLVVFLFSLGALAGFLAGLLGVGGGIVLVPGLYMIFGTLQPKLGFDPSYLMHLSVGTSLAVIIPTGLSSALSHHKKGSVDFSILKQLGLGIIMGVVLAAWIAKGLDGRVMKMIFATVIMILAFIMMLGHKRFQARGDIKQPHSSIAGVIIGLVSTLVGIGGATLSVPYMSLHGVSMHRAIGSASALGLVISVPAAIGFIAIGTGVENLPPYSFGYVNALAWLCIVPASVLVAPLGAKAAHTMSVKRLKIIFAVFMIFIALSMWYKILMGA